MVNKQDYTFLLTTISDDIVNKDDQQFIKDNLPILVKQLTSFSKYLTHILDIVYSDIPTEQIISELKQIHFNQYRINDQEARHILKLLKDTKIQSGGFNDTSSKHVKPTNFKDIHQVAAGLVNIASPLISGILGTLISSSTDYKSDIDYVYIILFILASLPFIGFIPNIMIIVRALREGRTFLAILTCITTFLSLFTLHSIDLGIAIKIIYGLDVYTAVNYVKKPVEILKSQADKYYGQLKDVVNTSANTNTGLLSNVTGNLSNIFENVKQNAIQNAEQAIQSKISSTVQNTQDKLANKLNDKIASTVQNTQDNLANKLNEKLNATINAKLSNVKVEEPVVKVDEPVVKVDEPVVKVEEPAVKVDEPVVKVDEPVVTVSEKEKEKVNPQSKIDESAVHNTINGLSGGRSRSKSRRLYLKKDADKFYSKK